MNIFPKKLTVKQAVIATLAYFNSFGVPLTRSEISEYLLFQEPDEGKIDIYLRESPLIHLVDGYYSLKGEKNFYKDFFEKRDRSRLWWKRVRRFQWLFNSCPFIKFVAVVNSLPIRDIKENSDIDLFIVTQKNKMFTARFALTAALQILGLRRHGDKTSKRFCLSFYVSEDRLDFKDILCKPYDIYLAYWIKTMEPLAGDYQIYEALIHSNEEWLKAFFGKRMPKRNRYFRRPKLKQIERKRKLEQWTHKWERKQEKKQLERAREKYSKLEDKSGTVISKSMLKFHNKDRRSDIRENWEKSLKEVL